MTEKEHPQKDKPWVMRTYAGHSTAEASNALYRTNLAKGQTGLSVAFDLPTQTGYDPDSPLARGEVGKVGVPVPHLGEMRKLFADIPLTEMNTSMTINATAMWLLAINGLVYLAYGILAGHFRRKLLPISPRAVLADVRNALRGRLAHDDLSVYNAAQRAAYLALVVLLVLLVASGLAIWKPVQLYWLAALMGDYEGARYVHFIAMTGICVFIAVHVVMVALVPRTLLAMLRGR